MSLPILTRSLAKAGRAFMICGLLAGAVACKKDDVSLNGPCYPTQSQKMEQKVKDIEVIQKYLTDNKVDANLVKSTESGLHYMNLQPGTGRQIKVGDNVQVHYIGKTLSGSTFDSSYDRSQTFPVMVGYSQVIAGWQEALPLMSVGEETRFYIPSYLAYGPCGSQSLGPNAVLIFDIKVVSVQ
ncbi:FKBP-type peptidyl-prolyl cis-trans isomerase [Pontibacter arcticus]|uniref:Peptidyl-prolyl cis-trans isomerase n=1 Tax=Pontibacter arcticus TaxID=2080288 RepID=A0A364RIA7_9BACT|nr:FKBP-type peptidyl-prolyl cis-trans isomerase [Pontibacter arcticus]RAU83956.1 peptidylprolyl isomerase [Pontibacter arcticus]